LRKRAGRTLLSKRRASESWLADELVFSESPIHKPRKEARDEVYKQDNKVYAFDLLFVDCPQGGAEAALLTKDADKVARFEYQDNGEPDYRETKEDGLNGFSRIGVHLQ
jgi:hypothetical protein